MPARRAPCRHSRAVEVAGFEPASFGHAPGLLRAQPARRFLGPGAHAGKSPTGPVAVRLSLLTPRPGGQVESPHDARSRAGDAPGLTESLLAQAARANSDCFLLAVIFRGHRINEVATAALGPLPLARSTEVEASHPRVHLSRTPGPPRRVRFKPYLYNSEDANAIPACDLPVRPHEGEEPFAPCGPGGGREPKRCPRPRRRRSRHRPRPRRPRLDLRERRVGKAQ